MLPRNTSSNDPHNTISISATERSKLRKWLNNGDLNWRLRYRAGIILDSAAGFSGQEIADRQYTTPQTVSKWRKRFIAGGMEGLRDSPRSGQPKKYSNEQIDLVIDTTVYQSPIDGPRWTTRKLAKELSLSPVVIHRIWREFGLQPHYTNRLAFPFVTDPTVSNLNVEGLYLDKDLCLLVVSSSESKNCDCNGIKSYPHRPRSRNLALTQFGKRLTLPSLMANIIRADFQDIEKRKRAADIRRFVRRITARTELARDVGCFTTTSCSMMSLEGVAEIFLDNPRLEHHSVLKEPPGKNCIDYLLADVTLNQVRRKCTPSLWEMNDHITQHLLVNNDVKTRYQWVPRSG
jgi:transposase